MKRQPPQRGEAYDPFEHADQLGIRVIDRPIRTANGLWIPDHNLIVIRSGMKSAWVRSTLAHEIGHAVHGHRDDRPKHEIQADRYAAENLIDMEELQMIATGCGSIHQLATELHVTGQLLRVFLNVHHLAG